MANPHLHAALDYKIMVKWIDTNPRNEKYFGDLQGLKKYLKRIYPNHEVLWAHNTAFIPSMNEHNHVVAHPIGYYVGITFTE